MDWVEWCVLIIGFKMLKEPFCHVLDFEQEAHNCLLITLAELLCTDVFSQISKSFKNSYYIIVCVLVKPGTLVVWKWNVKESNYCWIPISTTSYMFNQCIIWLACLLSSSIVLYCILTGNLDAVLNIVSVLGRTNGLFWNSYWG